MQKALRSTWEVICLLPAWLYILFLGMILGAGAFAFIFFYGRNDYPKSQIDLGNQFPKVVYNTQTKSPSWVLQSITSESIRSMIETSQQFQANPNIPKSVRAEISDYEGSGFDIGQLLLPIYADKPQELSYLSSVCPQVPELKKGYWKLLENHIIKLSQGRGKIIVISGPLYLSQDDSDGKRYVKYQVIGRNKVAVPTHFFNVVYLSGNSSEQPEMFIIPNEDINESVPLSSFRLASQEEFERKSGLLLPKSMWSYYFTMPPHF